MNSRAEVSNRAGLLDVVLEGAIRLKGANRTERAPVLCSQAVKESLNLGEQIGHALLQVLHYRLDCAKLCLQEVAKGSDVDLFERVTRGPKKPSTAVRTNARSMPAIAWSIRSNRALNGSSIFWTSCTCTARTASICWRRKFPAHWAAKFSRWQSADNAHSWPHLLLQSAQGISHRHSRSAELRVVALHRAFGAARIPLRSR